MQLTLSVWIEVDWSSPAAQNSECSTPHYIATCFYPSQTQKLSKGAHRPLRGLIRSAHALTESLTGQKPAHKVQVKVLKTQAERETCQCITFYTAALLCCIVLNCIMWEIPKHLPWLGCENYSLIRYVFGIPLTDLNIDFLHPHQPFTYAKSSHHYLFYNKTSSFPTTDYGGIHHMQKTSEEEK